MMIRIASAFVLTALLFLSANFLVAQPHSATVTVKNPIDLNRTSETIVLNAADLRRTLAVEDIRKIHVRDDAGKELLTQAVDNNDDGTFDDFIFQIDIGPNSSKTFTLVVADRQIPRKEDFKAYGRFVQERRDDYAWENDRIAHRMYGKELETWPQEPLTSSGVDIWTKRVPRLVVNEWYMTDDYHHDHGDGADMYSVGKSRGCGGNGLFVDGKLYVANNFIHSHSFANGPIRVMFELEYPAWNAGGVQVSEVKRITLDAGQNLDRFESHYTIQGGNGKKIDHGVGIKQNAGFVQETRADAGTIRTWEPVKADGSQLGCAVVVPQDQLIKFAEDGGNILGITKLPANGIVSYYAGFGWNKSGQFANTADWDRYVAEWSRKVKSPLQVTITTK
jgi:hypothetical protein